MKKIISLLIVFFIISCQDKPLDDFQKLADLDSKLETPKAGEWLAEHPEKGQTFEQYSKLKPITVSDKLNTIYIQPIGEFNEQENKIVDYTVEYLQLFFGIKTIKMPVVSESMIDEDHKRIIEDNNEQLDASYIIQTILPPLKPKDGIVIMGITSKDLYPKPSWNYVFGLANYSEGTGVSSIYRYAPNDKNYSICLGRTIKTSAHEIGHMFKMKHCTNAVCLMNGVNSLSEAETRPNALCSVCLKKISWNLKFNNPERFKKLILFLEKHHLQKDAEILKDQYQLIEK